MIVALAIGFLFGFVGSMPIAGPLAAVILARALGGRYRSAIVIGLGGGIADAIYAYLALWGFASLLKEYAWLEPVSQGVATLIMLALGVMFLRGQGAPTPAAIQAESEGSDSSNAPPTGRASILKSFILGFSLVALNPTLLATWAGASAALMSTGLIEITPEKAPWFAIGAAAGVTTWLAFLVGLIRRYRERFKPETIGRMMRGMGVLLIIVGLWFGWNFFRAMTQ